MESVSIGWITALSNADQLFNLIHLLEQLLVLSIDELNLALLADDFLLSLLLVEIFSDSCVAGGASRDHLKTRYLLVSHAHLLVQ